ncbi:hypothetical protein [Microbacterium lacusdiani]
MDESLISRTSADTEGGRGAAAELLDRPDRPTAVFCFNDEVAMGVYQVAAARCCRPSPRWPSPTTTWAGGPWSGCPI